jgi:NTE family protein
MLLKADAEHGKMQQQRQQLPYLFDPRSWTYLYDHSPLANTLDKYIDYKKLNLAAT